MKQGFLSASLLAVVIFVSNHARTHAQVESYTYVEDKLPFLVPKAAWWKRDGGRPYHVFLTLDGGGLRGIISATVLVELEKQIKMYALSHLQDFDVAYMGEGKTVHDYNLNTIEDFHVYIADYFDGIAGISAGSWLTAYLVTKGGKGNCLEILSKPSVVNKYGSLKPGTAEGLRVFFLEYGSTIYPTPAMPISLKRRFWATPLVNVKMMSQPLYPPSGLEWLLKKFVGDVKLSEVSTSMLVVAYDLYQASAVQFVADYIDAPGSGPVIYTGTCITHSPASLAREPADVGQRSRRKQKKLSSMDKVYRLDYYVRDLVRASSAFPMVQGSKIVKPLNDITNVYDMIDGAMVGNNPTLPTLAWALTHDSIDAINQTAFLSLGTGYAQGAYEGIGEGGIAQWMLPMIDIVTASTPEYIQALMNYHFYSPRRDDLVVRPNQLLRIQLVKYASTPEGQLLMNLAAPRQDLIEMEKLATLLGAKYRESIAHFVATFICSHTSAPA